MTARLPGGQRDQRLAGATALLLATLFWSAGSTGASASAVSATEAEARARVAADYGRLPLSFEINRGQTDRQVKFLARGDGYGLFLTPREAVLNLRPAQSTASKRQGLASDKAERGQQGSRAAVVRMTFAHSNAAPEISGLDPLPGTSNYFIGNDPAQWKTEVKHFARVKYTAVYPGIDLIYYGNQRQLEYDFVVAPGADPRRIELVFEGVRRLSIDANGNLTLATADGNLVQHKPRVYQEVGGKRVEISGQYALKGRYRAGFHVARYDAALPLVIDPTLAFSTYLGGSGYDWPSGIAADASGNAYVTGHTSSADFPTTSGAVRPNYIGDWDTFVTKLGPDGALIYSTFLGGSGADEGAAITVDTGGSAYVTGQTSSADFPVTAGAYQTAISTGTFVEDAFVTKLNPNGSALVYSTYLGGNHVEDPRGIAVDGSGNAYIAGETGSINFPTTPSAPQRVFGGESDGFVSKLDASGAALIYSTLLGGDQLEEIGGIAVDAGGSAYVTGTTYSSDFPTTAGAFLRVRNGRADAFVAKVNAAGTAFSYSTLLGGCCEDLGYAIAVDNAGNAYVAGGTSSTDFPITPGAYQSVHGGGDWDAYVAKLDASGSALIYSTYLGGAGHESVGGIAVDASRNVYVVGDSASSNFPTTDGAVQRFYGGNTDAFIAKFNATGGALLYSTFLGGSAYDAGRSLALDGRGNAYIAGGTSSSDFPIANAVPPLAYHGKDEAFVTRIAGMATPQTLQIDCLFNWAEKIYPNFLAPAGAVSGTFAPYYYRYYPQANAYVGATNDHLYYLGPFSNNSVLDLGALADWVLRAGCQ